MYIHLFQLALSIVTVAFTLGCVLLWLRKRKRNTKSVNNVTYHSQNEDVKVDTSTNEADKGVDISTSINASYQSVQRDNDDSLEYDYA